MPVPARRPILVARTTAVRRPAALGMEERFALLLTDVVLPRASGLDLAVVLAARWPEIEVILMSGYSEDEALREDAATGRINYLQKPFGIEVLARRLRELLGPAPDPPGA